jgi:phage portal protein BeeE
MTTPIQEMWHNPAMALFTRKETKAQMSPAPAQKAAAAGSYSMGNSGSSLVGQFYTYQQGAMRDMAMRVPSIARARTIHASIISAMPLKMYREQWNETDRETEYIDLAPRSWLRRPDPAIPYETLMAWLFDDLFFWGRAFLFISSRTADGFPASFSRLPAAMVSSPKMPQDIWFAPAQELEFNGLEIDPQNVVQFISPVEGIIYSNADTIATALKVEASRARNAETSIPSGILKQTGGEPLSAQELADLSAQFNAARRTNQTAALNEFLSYEATSATPDKMMLIESAQFSALQMAQISQLPPYLLGVPTGSYAYTNSRESRWDTWLFGTKLWAECIAATLSSNQVLPNGTFVEFDTNEYLGNIDDADTNRTMVETPDEPETGENRA